MDDCVDVVSVDDFVDDGCCNKCKPTPAASSSEPVDKVYPDSVDNSLQKSQCLHLSSSQPFSQFLHLLHFINELLAIGSTPPSWSSL